MLPDLLGSDEGLVEGIGMFISIFSGEAEGDAEGAGVGVAVGICIPGMTLLIGCGGAAGVGTGDDDGVGDGVGLGMFFMSMPCMSSFFCGGDAGFFFFCGVGVGFGLPMSMPGMFCISCCWSCGCAMTVIRPALKSATIKAIAQIFIIESNEKLCRIFISPSQYKSRKFASLTSNTELTYVILNPVVMYRVKCYFLRVDFLAFGRRLKTEKRETKCGRHRSEYDVELNERRAVRAVSLK